MAKTFSYYHLFVALSEETIVNILKDLQNIIDEWDTSGYSDYGIKEDYIKFHDKLKKFREAYKNVSNAKDSSELHQLMSPLLDKLEKIKSRGDVDEAD